jgi:hypothetical protein
MSDDFIGILLIVKTVCSIHVLFALLIFWSCLIVIYFAIQKPQAVSKTNNQPDKATINCMLLRWRLY